MNWRVVLFFYFFSVGALYSQDSLSTKSYNLGLQFLYSNYDSSEYYFKQAVEGFDLSKDYNKLVSSYNLLFVVNYFKGDFEESEKWIIKGLKILEKKKKI